MRYRRSKPTKPRHSSRKALHRRSPLVDDSVASRIDHLLQAHLLDARRPACLVALRHANQPIPSETAMKSRPGVRRHGRDAAESRAPARTFQSADELQLAEALRAASDMEIADLAGRRSAAEQALARLKGRGMLAERTNANASTPRIPWKIPAKRAAAKASASQISGLAAGCGKAAT